MQIFPVRDILAPAGLQDPDLLVLAPTVENYSAMLFQPYGDIEISSNGVRHADRDFANQQFGAFLEDALSRNANLAVTPEYSMPWDTLENKISEGVTPDFGNIWVIGCESITVAELQAFRDRVSPYAELLCEDMEDHPATFLNPVAYIFRTGRTGEENKKHPHSQLVILLQFKTCPMGDSDHFEINGLQTGSYVYCFGNGTTTLRMATLICSDAFEFLDAHAREIYDRTLLLHIQLNPKPRQGQFRQYRDRLMRFGGGQTELICLNWARDVQQRRGDSRTCWRNIAGSGWYLNPDNFDDRDETLTESHKRGLYYTWLESLRCHALFLNYAPAVYRFTATKVAHIGVTASLSRRRGPQLSETRIWNSAKSAWIACSSLDDGFTAAVRHCGGASSDVASMATSNPFSVERVLALTAGSIEAGIDWHLLQRLDSCSIDATEVVRRMTVCQDPDAVRFRRERFHRCGRLHSLLLSALPPAISDLKDGFRLDWSSESPHQNVISKDGRRATVIYLSDTCDAIQANAISKTVEDYLGRFFSEPDQIVEARQRLHVWYRNTEGDDVTVNSHAHLDYDDTRTASPFDIARTE